MDFSALMDTQSGVFAQGLAAVSYTNLTLPTTHQV